MSQLETRSEIVIVGAGIVGLTLAFELCRRGREVCVLDRGRPGDGATAAAGGMLAPVSEADTEPPELIELGQDSLERYPAVVAEVERISEMNCGYLSEGTLWAAVQRDDWEDLEHLARLLESRRLRFERWTDRQVLAREPHLSSRVLGGLYVPDDHQVDPRALTRALLRALERCGARVLAQHRVERIEREPGQGSWSVLGRRRGEEGFRIEGDCAVVAAGVWSDGELHPSLLGWGVRPVKGQLLRLHGERLAQHVIRTPDVYVIPRTDGELLLGATLEEMGFDETPTAGAMLDLLRHAWQLLPGVYDLDFREVSVGLRSAVDDHLPVIGAVDPHGLFAALGHFRNGILLAPATAHYLADWICSGEPAAELLPFRPERLLACSDIVTAQALEQEPGAQVQRQGDHQGRNE